MLWLAPDRRRLLRTIALIVGVVVAVIALAALVDLAGPPQLHTHLARTVVGEDALTTILRKLNEAVGNATSPFVLVGAVGVAAIVLMRRRVGEQATIRTAGWALVVAAVAGSLLNDSGLVVGAAVVAVSWPVLMSESWGGGPAPGDGDGAVVPAALPSQPAR